MPRLNEYRVGAVLTEPLAVRASTSTASTPHAPHGAALFVGLDADVTVAEPGRVPVRGRVVLAPPERPYAAACPGPLLGILYDPEAMPRVAGFTRRAGEVFRLEGREAERFAAAATGCRAELGRPEVLEGLAREFAAFLGGRAGAPPPIDARVRHALEALREPAARPGDAAARSGLSRAHLQALFARDVGRSMRSYRLWCKLLSGVALLGRREATGAALEAGFADLAHFSRTCRAMLGYSPTLLRRGLLENQTPSPAGSSAPRSYRDPLRAC